MTISSHALTRARQRFGFKAKQAKGHLHTVIRRGICTNARDDAIAYTYNGITAVVRDGCVLTVRRTNGKGF